MLWKKLARSRWARNIICAALAAAVVLTLCLPVVRREEELPENPIPEAEVQQITALQTGEAESLSSYAAALSAQTEGKGGGQQGKQEGADGQGVPGENSDQSQSVSEEQQQENVEGQPKPEDGPSREQLSDAEVGTNEVPSEAGEQGQQGGEQGEEGGEDVELDLAAVMTWYKYGTEEKTIVCQPGSTVGKEILTTQLPNDLLRYRFDLTGFDADGVDITSVTCAAGNGVPRQIDRSGTIETAVPADPGYRNFVFQVEAVGQVEDSQGQWMEHTLTFTFVLRCESGKDLELELTWQKADGQSSITCAANGTASREIKSSELVNGEFSYQPALKGLLASDSQLIAGEYRTASGEYGTLSLTGGSLPMEASDSGSETYYLSFTAKLVQRDFDGDTVEETVTYSITIVYTDTMDLQLSFTWFEQGITRRELICDLNESVSDTVKNNQLNAGSLLYEMELTGNSAKNARIKAIAAQLDGSSTSVSANGALPMTIPAGSTSVICTFMVTVEVEQQTAIFTVSLRLTNDVSLQMDYAIYENGAALPQQLRCENKRTVTADTVYDDQLTDGQLTYTMSLLGEDAQNLEITGVQCYQSGSMKTLYVSSSGSVKLLLDGARTGENTFTVTAQDAGGQIYTFTINIPYKHRGDNLVKIQTNLADGMEVTNGESINLTVRAWTEDGDGNTVSIIRATGTDTILTVTLNGEEIAYISASGDSQEYTLIPQNPETGDSNEHVLQIYAQDEFGNYGEQTITLIGSRTQEGQPIGTATVYVDMTVLGLGVNGPVSYTILSGESVAYVTAKVLWGEDFGDPFGYSENTFGYAGGRTGGSYETGFYLASLYTGGGTGANALTGQRWEDFGSTEAEVLEYIDNYFGKGSGLATLWRCIYRNGLTLSTESSGAIGEYDYTGGSGWLYSVGSGTYYPGQSMSDYYLQDGDTLTFRYTLAQGWDIGGGTDNYGNTVGYCVSAINGSFAINHRMQEVTNEQGGTNYVCQCCGLTEDCQHTNTVCKDQTDGTHSIWCDDCAMWISNPQPHTWSMDEAADAHLCTECGLSEMHDWRLISDTASCVKEGTKTESCAVCGNTREQVSPATGIHVTGNQWHYDDTSHYQKCQNPDCGQPIEGSTGSHRFVFDGYDDWKCRDCGALHGFDLEHNVQILTQTCQHTIYSCDICGQLEGPGDNATHSYDNTGWCPCGMQDPNFTDPEEENGTGNGGGSPDPDEGDGTTADDNGGTSNESEN